MNHATLRQAIAHNLAALEAGPLAEGARTLLATLGYQSERWIDLEPPTVDTFLDTFDQDQRLNRLHARVAEWRSIAMVAQLTSAELATTPQLQLAFAEQPAFAAQTYQSLLFFAVDLAGKPDGRPYTRGELAAMTRELNKLFLMPVSVFFRHGQAVTLAIVTHRPNRRDANRDVLEKVSLIREIRCRQPHRAHLDILADLSLPALAAHKPITGFDDLQQAWARALDTAELNKRFYREIANWYFWAVERVQLPELPDTPREQRNAVAMIRLLTRLIFVWFLKEKGLAPAELFDRTQVERLLVSLEPNESTYYRAILQNLFFATLNQEMDRRAFRDERSFQGRNAQHGVSNLYRYRALFRQPDQALALFGQIPFLNGGLFECLDDPAQKLYVDGFSDNPRNQPVVPNELFFAGPTPVDLNRAYGTAGRRYEVRGLIEILDRYKFTVAENTPVEEDVALDPELLGQVFENLLAAYNPETETTARKETGSFYTPRSVVNYMVDESLVIYLQEQLAARVPPPAKTTADDHAAPPSASLADRLRELLAYSDRPVAELFSPAEIDALIAAIDALTVIDPACGSGAFPMGVLQKLVHILNRLDPDNRRWRETQRQRALRETGKAYQIDNRQEREQRLLDISEAFELNSSDYGRKLFLIENCIYGVDIQPIAVQIAKLRCFISLIVDQQLHRTLPNWGIRPLPNLETKFVAADALISVERPQQMALRSPEVERLEGEVREVRERYFRARSAADKRAYRQRDHELREQLAEQLQSDGWPSATAMKLAQWDPYAQNESAPFFDPEWMFGKTDGFSIVIANPPYVRQELLKDYKPKLAGYQTYSGTADLYVYFYERAVELLAPGGILTFISSNKYFRAAYGQKLRRYLAEQTIIHQIIDFGDAPVFTAIAYPSIIVAQKPREASLRSPAEAHRFLAITWQPGDRIEELPRIAAAARANDAFLDQQSLDAESWRLAGSATQRLLDKLRRAGLPLEKYVDKRFYRGILTGLNEAFVVDRATRDRLIAAHPSSAEVLKPFLRGRDVKRWHATFAEQYLIKIESSENKTHPWSGKSDREAEHIFATQYPALYNWFSQFRDQLIKRSDQGKYFWELRACAYWQAFERAKIVYQEIATYQAFAWDASKHYTNNKCFIIPDGNLYLLGLLNSTIVWFFLGQVATKLQGGAYQMQTPYVSQLPIPNKAEAAQDRAAIEQLVRQILALVSPPSRAAGSAEPGGSDGGETGAAAGGQGPAYASQRLADLEREIDERVYRLFQLTSDEIKHIEATVRGGGAG